MKKVILGILLLITCFISFSQQQLTLRKLVLLDSMYFKGVYLNSMINDTSAANGSTSNQGMITGRAFWQLKQRLNAIGVGTPGNIPKFTSSFTFGNSVMQELNGNIGFGKTPSSGFGIDMNNGINIVGTGTQVAQFIGHQNIFFNATQTVHLRTKTTSINPLAELYLNQASNGNIEGRWLAGQMFAKMQDQSTTAGQSFFEIYSYLYPFLLQIDSFDQRALNSVPVLLDNSIGSPTGGKIGYKSPSQYAAILKPFLNIPAGNGVPIDSAKFTGADTSNLFVFSPVYGSAGTLEVNVNGTINNIPNSYFIAGKKYIKYTYYDDGLQILGTVGDMIPVSTKNMPNGGFDIVISGTTIIVRGWTKIIDINWETTVIPTAAYMNL